MFNKAAHGAEAMESLDSLLVDEENGVISYYPLLLMLLKGIWVIFSPICQAFVKTEGNTPMRERGR